jgi:hypothetical protein
VTATAAFTAAACSVPAVTMTTRYDGSDPCLQIGAGPGCGDEVEFNSSWHAQITVRWSSPDADPIPGLCVSPNYSHFSGNGNPGSLSFPSTRGTSTCQFGSAGNYPAGAVWENLTVIVKTVSPPF